MPVYCHAGDQAGIRRAVHQRDRKQITQQPNGIFAAGFDVAEVNGVGRTSENSEEWYLVTRSRQWRAAIFAPEGRALAATRTRMPRMSTYLTMKVGVSSRRSRARME